MKKVIVVYGGGFQPFHQGHMSSYEEAKRAFPNADFYVASSNDTKVRPIPFNDKKFLAQQAGVKDDFVQVKQPVNPEEILRKYNPDQDILILVRSERDPVKYTKKDGSPAYYQPFKNLKDCKPFNPDSGHGYIFVTKKKDFSVAGEVVYSGSQVRKMYSTAKDDERVKIVKDLYPHATNPEKVKKLLDKYIGTMNEELEQQDEAVLDIAARRKRAAIFKRLAPRIQRARMRQMSRVADPARLKSRALRAAYKFFRRNVSGGQDYAQLGVGQKIAIDTKLQKLLPAIRKFAVRLVPQVRRTEIQRRQSMIAHQKEEYNVNDMFSLFVEGAKLPQDKDVKGREGTQPSKYYKGMDKSTKQARAAHFERTGPKSDSDPSAYADAPGDKEAREKGMPQSKHTKKYKQMFGEAADRKSTSRLDQLVRMGLADAKLLSTIKRSVDKLNSGDALNPAERKATQDLLQTLLDMVLSTDSLFRMTKQTLQKEDVHLNELVYKGNIGVMEMFEFFQKATPQQIAEMKKLIAEKKNAEALQLLAKVTGKKLHTESFNLLEQEDWEEIDGLQMAQIEVANLIQDTEHLASILDNMDEEPEAWVLSKITKAVDYIESVTDYLEFEGDFDYEDDSEDDDGEYTGSEDEFDMEMEEAFLSMDKEELGDLYEEVTQIFEEVEGLKKKAEKSGIPYGILKQVYNRGMAAWQGGHRPGTTPQQWAFARVNSFITKGKGTWGGADSDLAAKVKKNEEFSKFVEALEWGTDEMRKAYARTTPGQSEDIINAKYSADSALEYMNDANRQRLFKLYSEDKKNDTI